MFTFQIVGAFFAFLFVLPIIAQLGDTHRFR